MAITASRAPERTPSIRGLRALYGSVAVSSLGDGVFGTAVPLAAAATTRDPAAVAVVAAAEMVPWLVVTPVVGALVDRWPHRATMVAADVVRLALLAVLAALVATSSASVAALATIACAVMIGTIFFDTASQAVVADIVHRDPAALNKANGVVSSTTQAGRDLVGPPTGSAAYSIVPWVPFVVDAVSFAISALLVSRLPTSVRPAREDTDGRQSLAASIAEGARWLVRHKQLRTLCLMIAASNLAYSAGTSTFVLYATDVLSVSTAVYGLLLSAGAVGGIAGGFLAARVVKRLGDIGSLVIGILAQAGAFVIIAVTPSPYLAAVGLAMASFGTVVATVVVVGARQRLAPPEMLGRITASFRMLGVGALPAGATAGGIVASLWGLHAPLIGAAGLFALILPAAAVLRGKSDNR